MYCIGNGFLIDLRDYFPERNFSTDGEKKGTMETGPKINSYGLFFLFCNPLATQSEVSPLHGFEHDTAMLVS